MQLATAIPFQGTELPRTGSPKTEWPPSVRGAEQSVATAPAAAPRRNWLRAMLTGLAVAAAQIFVAVVLIAPEGPLTYRYETLIQHDSYWFANIIDRGYDTIMPPMIRKMMEVSNVAFFPAYPAIAGAMHHWLGLSINQALLVTAQLAAWGFWTYFFLFCDRWRVSSVVQFFGAAIIVCHPTAFFLVAGYSESLFLMALLGFMYWTTEPGRTAKFIAAAHGIVMSATRIVGIPCAAFPVVHTFFSNRLPRRGEWAAWIGAHMRAAALMFAGMLGAIGFFIYCAVRWGRWDMYMLTQESGWAIYPDYLAVFKLESYRWVLPPLNDPTQWSQVTMTAGALIFVAVAVIELAAMSRGRTGWRSRMGIYFGALITYYIAVSGVASVQMESMSRYQFCAHALVVLALMHFLGQVRAVPVPVRALGMLAAALACAASLSLQGWWIWNFTRGGWVA